MPVSRIGSPWSDPHVDSELRFSVLIADDEGFEEDSDRGAVAVNDMDLDLGDSTHLREEQHADSVGAAKHIFISKLWE